MNFSFTFKGSPLIISVPNTGTAISSNEYRPYPCLAFPDEADFRNDTEYMVKAFEQTQMNRNEDYIYPIVAMCQKHIQQYGRIVDNDLFIYIDQMTLILKAFHALQGRSYSLADGQKLWNLSKTTLFSVFEAHVWVDKRHYLGFGANELVPLNTVVSKL
ncbi:hypothetical protein [Pedobacter sp. SL55]|uniref:hypothetical protein n=1 Tax=Pedobacter sp. SL55 TaxID=2995161 RepID=UPI002271344C|nr:hypothetical protein [Pedobacter sp. SL55]WAC39243.1 hypothetical protein OVA16_11550 [Pedobacter sp. SL55]